MRAFAPTLSLLLWSGAALADDPAPPEDDIVARAMRDEIARSTTQLRIADMEPPYYVGYAALDLRHTHLSAAYGSLFVVEDTRRRQLEVDVRAGDYTLDSSRAGFEGPVEQELPLDDDYFALRHAMWLATDRAYKRATEVFQKKKAGKANRAASESDPPDFSREEPARRVVAPKPLDLDVDALGARMRTASLVFEEFPQVQYGTVELTTLAVRRYFANSEGTLTVETLPVVKLTVLAQTQAEDGMALSNYRTVMGRGPAEMPSDADLAQLVRDVARELVGLRTAPRMEAYSGPVLFEGIAAAQLTKALLGSNLSGTPPASFLPAMFRKPSELADKLGKTVLPKAISIHDDPTVEEYAGTSLVGHYTSDDEGVPARRVALVERGVLSGLLMSRVPRQDAQGSNGHGRGPLGIATAGPANLFVEAKAGLPAAALRKRMLAAAKKAGEDYAVVVRRLAEPSITGGDSMRSMFSAGQSGSVVPAPLVAVRVYADGKEELVRGLQLPSISVRALKDIIGWSKRSRAFNFGATHQRARSASVFASLASFTLWQFPLSVIVPDLLFEEIDVTKVTDPSGSLPLVPHPLAP